jgi:two-component system nitrate/nitrite response regulator NarL
LIADDYEVVRRGVASILSSRKDIEACDGACNGEQAVEKARELNPDMVILDITMPVLDGFGAAKQIRSFLPKVPILFLSMQTAREFVQQAKAVGAQRFVNKEQAGTTLLKAVDTLSRNETFFPA